MSCWALPSVGTRWICFRTLRGPKIAPFAEMGLHFEVEGFVEPFENKKGFMLRVLKVVAVPKRS